MAKGRKTGGKDFEPGHPNIGGRPPLPEWVRQCKKMVQKEFIEALSNLAQLPLDQVKELIKEESIPIHYAIMANWLAQACTDDRSRQSFFDRLYGKVSDKLEVKMPKPFVIHKSDGTQLVMGVNETDGEV